MPVLKSDQFDAAVRAGKIGSTYLFDGPESWLKERAVQVLLSKLLTQDARDFNLDKFHGSNASPGDIISSARSVPFLSEKRVIVVEEVDELSNADAGLIADQIPDFPDSTCLILVSAGKTNPRDPLGAAVLSHGNVVTFWTPFPNQMPRWIQDEARRRGVSLDGQAAQALADACLDLQQISNELDKLMIFVGKKTAITLKDVLDFGLPDESGDQKLFETALSERRLDMALQQSHLLQEQGVRPEAIFPTIDRLFRQLCLVYYYVRDRGMNWEEAAGEIGIRGITHKRQLETAFRVYTRQEAETAFSKIAEADFQMKTGLLSGEISMSLLLLSLLKRDSVRA